MMGAGIVQEIRLSIRQMAEEDYRRFSASLLPGTEGILGVRLPKLRKLALQLAKGPWREYLSWAEQSPFPLAFEERMLHGMVIGAAPTDFEEALRYAQRFIPFIDNWSVCDSFCAGFSSVSKNRERMLDFIQPYLKSPAEFEARFGLVILLDYFVEEPYLPHIFGAVLSLQSVAYYAKMAAAWLLSLCYVKYPRQTEAFLKSAPIDHWILQKTLQKTVEFRRVSTEEREKIRRWKKEVGKNDRQRQPPDGSSGLA